MAFLESFLWGTGLSLGICVGLVAWAFLRTGVYKLLGVTASLESNLQFNRESLAALQERNRLTCDTNDLLGRIALTNELRFQRDLGN